MGIMIGNKVSGVIDVSTNKWSRSDIRSKSMTIVNLRRKRDNYSKSAGLLALLKATPCIIKHE